MAASPSRSWSRPPPRMASRTRRSSRSPPAPGGAAHPASGALPPPLTAGVGTGYIRAPTLVLWRAPPRMVYAPLIVMPSACILLIAGYSTPNPTAVGMEGVAGDDDPAPGIMRVTRHPIMWAVGLWALSHLAVNGDLASLIFFGSLAALPRGGSVLIDRKKRLALGSNWPRLAEVTLNIPFLAILTGRTRLRLHEIGLLRIVAGLLLYAVLLLAHPLYTGHVVVIP